MALTVVLGRIITYYTIDYTVVVVCACSFSLNDGGSTIVPPSNILLSIAVDLYYPVRVYNTWSQEVRRSTDHVIKIFTNRIRVIRMAAF